MDGATLKKEVSIISFQTILDAIDKNSRFHDTAKLFFSTLAHESAKNFTIRKHYAFMPLPVFNLLFRIISELYQEYESKSQGAAINEKIDVIETILAGVDQDRFSLDDPPIDSVFELGMLLGDEKDTNINIVCNETDAEPARQRLIKNNNPLKKYETKPMTTENWVVKHLTSSNTGH